MEVDIPITPQAKMYAFHRDFRNVMYEVAKEVRRLGIRADLSAHDYELPDFGPNGYMLTEKKRFFGNRRSRVLLDVSSPAEIPRRSLHVRYADFDVLKKSQPLLTLLAAKHGVMLDFRPVES